MDELDGHAVGIPDVGDAHARLGPASYLDRTGVDRAGSAGGGVGMGGRHVLDVEADVHVAGVRGSGVVRSLGPVEVLEKLALRGVELLDEALSEVERAHGS